MRFPVSLSACAGAAVLAAGLDHVHVAGVLHHAKQAAVPAGVGAEVAALALGQVAAVGAEADLGVELGKVASQLGGQGGVGLEQVKGQALGGLAAVGLACLLLAST